MISWALDPATLGRFGAVVLKGDDAARDYYTRAAARPPDPPPWRGPDDMSAQQQAGYRLLRASHSFP